VPANPPDGGLLPGAPDTRPPSYLPPSKPEAHLDAPEGGVWQPSPGSRLYPPPDSAPNPGGGLPKAGVKEEQGLTPALPVGIPQFNVVKNKVASGLRPPTIDGLDWLAQNGYRTALHLKAPGQDDSADRHEFEKRGLKFVSLEVSPDTLTREVVGEFNAVVGDAASLPLFVYDKDGMLAGGLWYLHFRIIEGVSDEDATARAARLGLKENREGEHRVMWLAIQKYLSGAKDK
jgi:protein tyrosine phosphatase (PTP) superfamily phosphohydrolase (DUF442 family)